jgi:tetratricopeptide (TPR) repeat protein
MKRQTMLLVFIIVSLISCNYHSTDYPQQMVQAEGLLTKNPQKALSLLLYFHKDIKLQPKNVQMYYCILLFRAQDLCYVPHKSKKDIDDAVVYFKKHHDNNKLMDAYYCVGCFYRDQKDFPKTATAFQYALTAGVNSKDYSMKGRIYNQLAQLNDVPKDAISLYKKSAVFLSSAHDSITWAYALRDIAAEYQSINRYDSAMAYAQKAYQLMLTLNDKEAINNMENEIANYYLSLNEIGKAKVFLDKSTGTFTNSDDASLYYMNMGRYYNNINRADSSIFYLNLCVNLSDNLTFKYNSYLLLYDIYKKRGLSKKALYYMEKANDMNKQISDIIHEETVTKINANSDYKRAKKELSYIKSEYAYGSIIFIVIIIAISVIIYLKKKKRVQTVDEDISDICLFFKKASSIAGNPVKDNQWAQFIDKMDEKNEYFRKRLFDRYSNMSTNEWRACYLIKADFNPSEMSRLLNMSPTGISSLRSRLYTKITQRKGNAKDLDKLIREL